MPYSYIPYLLSACGIFSLLFLLFQKKNAYQKQLWELEKHNLSLQEKVKHLDWELNRLTIVFEEVKENESKLRDNYQTLLIKYSETETKLKEEVKNFSERALILEKTEQRYSELFKSLSSEALKQNNESFLQLAQSSLEKFQLKASNEFEKKEQVIHQIIKPVRESLEKFELRVRDIEQARVGAYATLTQQVQSLMEFQNLLRQETSNLVKALRAPNIRGRWGEIQLKRVVELAGMQDHCDFYEQEMTYTDEEKRLRPDLLVRLPGNKNIIIDAKAPLSAYFEAMDADSSDLRLSKLKEHSRIIRTHITQLSKKNYWDQFNPTPEFVVLFLPGESFFSAALENDPALIETGVDQKVILATPTTLIALLRAIAYGWRGEKLSQNAEQISNLGRDLYKRIVDMTSHFTKLGKGLNQAIQSYNKAVGTLETRVLVTARRFKELESVGGEGVLEPLEPIEHISRFIQAPEMANIELMDDLKEESNL